METANEIKAAADEAMEAKDRLVRELVRVNDPVRIFEEHGGEAMIGHVSGVEREKDRALVFRPTGWQAYFEFFEFRYVLGMWEVVWCDYSQRRS